MSDLVKEMRGFEIDHEPDGWPAIRMRQVSALCDEIERLHQVCRDAYEVWAGSEGFAVPTTASEAYALQQLCLMRDEVKKGLASASS